MPSGRVCPACRKTLLSRYNRQPLCGPCTRAAKTAPPGQDGYTAAAWMWDSQLLRDALAQLDLPAVVAIFRASAGLSQQQLGDITGWSQGTLSFFENGQRETLYDIRELLRFADAVEMPREALLPLVLGRPDAALPDDWFGEVTLAGLGVQEETDVDVDRRTFGGITAGAAAAMAFPEITVPAKVGASHIRYLQICVDNLCRQDQTVGGAALLRQALRQWQRARRMLDESDYSEVVGQELLRVTGNLATRTGWLAFDAANVPLARRLYSEAWLLAAHSNDHTLQAHVLDLSSMLTSHLARAGGAGRGLSRESLRLADHAADVARHQPIPRLHALIALRRADAVSLLGDKPAFQAAIARARRELDRGARDDDPPWIQFVDESEIASQEAKGHHNLGDPKTASAFHRQSLDVPGISRRNRACGQAQLAGALADSGDVSEAVREGLSVLPTLSAGVTSIRTLNYLRPVRVAAERTTAEGFCVDFDAVERTLMAKAALC
jgi:transcriptional regulator with XRE-family HTH domain